jgi:hypothetical protein
MEITLNQLIGEFETIAAEHRQINEFFWGDFLDAVSRDSVNYPLMVCTLQPSSMDDGVVSVRLIVTICDKYNIDNFRQINEVHSDCLSICNDIKVTMKQERWDEFSDITTSFATDPFINRGQDVTAGWTMSVQADIFSADNWCEIPYDNYDFQND